MSDRPRLSAGPSSRTHADVFLCVFYTQSRPQPCSRQESTPKSNFCLRELFPEAALGRFPAHTKPQGALRGREETVGLQGPEQTAALTRSPRVSPHQPSVPMSFGGKLSNCKENENRHIWWVPAPPRPRQDLLPDMWHQKNSTQDGAPDPTFVHLPLGSCLMGIGCRAAAREKTVQTGKKPVRTREKMYRAGRRRYKPGPRVHLQTPVRGRGEDGADRERRPVSAEPQCVVPPCRARWAASRLDRGGKCPQGEAAAAGPPLRTSHPCEEVWNSGRGLEALKKKEPHGSV